MEIVFLIGRILFGGYFLMGGLNHFTKMEMMNNYAVSKGVPASKFLVGLTGLMLMLGGLGLLLGAYVPYAVTLLVVFLVVAAFKMHNFWALEEGTARMHDMRYFMVNFALAGAALMTLAIENWPMSL